MTTASIKCNTCDRQQSIVPANEPGGVTHLEAQSFGWVCTDGNWHCPFCTGRMQQLKRIFGEPTGGNPDGAA